MFPSFREPAKRQLCRSDQKSPEKATIPLPADFAGRVESLQSRSRFTTHSLGRTRRCSPNSKSIPFTRDGYLIMRGLVRGEELKLLRAAVDSAQAEGLTKGGADHRYYPNADDRKTYWRTENVWERDPIFRAVTVHPDMVENMGSASANRSTRGTRPSS
jgi:hypothetical protein